MKRLICMLSMIVFGSAANAQEKIKVAQDPQKTLGSANGRFVFGQISDFRSDQYMIDTQTGRLWQIVERTDEKGSPAGRALQVIPFVSVDGKLGLLPY
ncbi:MAG: hypothetical protein ACYC4K_10390 [Thiobacillus sp.]